MAESMIGRVFNNRYQITERIGIGGMAEVYRAQDNVLGRMVAVKVMLPQYAADPNFTQRFKQEAAAAANLQSPYIVNVYDWGQDDGTYYIVMEFVRGSDLKTAINQRGAINQRKMAEIGSQVCQALLVAHNLDIIHRDIKPQNIMVQPDGNVKVMDFGIARAKNSVMAQTSSVLGTAHYVSPEQAQGKELTAASDIYSLGVVLYEATTGKLPFDGPDAVSVAMQQVNDLPVPPRDINPNLDPALESIIMRAMAKNPAERFATAQDMRYALNDYLAGRSVNAGSAFNAGETAIMGGMVPPMAAPDSTSVMPVARSAGGMKPAGTSGSATNYRSNNEKPKNNKTAGIVAGVVAALAVVGFVIFAFMGGFSTGDPVPNVVGKSAEEAQAILEEAGFELGTIDKKYDDQIPVDQVLSQNPKAGEKREKGSKINITVSQGTEQVDVPDVAGLHPEEAKKLLKEKGLVPSAGEAAYSDDVEEGLVITTNPESGTTVDAGSTVEYIVSLGSEGIEVPSVVGMSEDTARATLEKAGFQVNVSRASDGSVPSSQIISQNPKAGERRDKDSIIDITVSAGPEKQEYYISVIANGGGDVSSSASKVEEGNSVVIKITPNNGYEVASCRGLDDVPRNGGTFTIPNVQNDINVQVTFQQISSGGGASGRSGGN